MTRLQPSESVTVDNDQANSINAEGAVTLQHLVIDLFVHSEAALRELVSQLEADLATYQELLHESLGMIAALANERDRTRARYHALLDERRRERAA